MRSFTKFGFKIKLETDFGNSIPKKQDNNCELIISFPQSSKKVINSNKLGKLFVTQMLNNIFKQNKASKEVNNKKEKINRHNIRWAFK
jgi:hypothetical protein